MTPLAIIGGSGLSRMERLRVERQWSVTTPWGEPSAPLSLGELDGAPVLFLPRHGAGHTLPPHRINYRANLWALKDAGATDVVAVAAVGGITPGCPPRSIAVPDQIIDYTWGRAHSYFDDAPVTHVDFTVPYTESLRQDLLDAARALAVDVRDGGTYGATQGPRLETAAEITRMARDGCDMVGMTGMPEAALARELGLGYATCAVVVNWGAGCAPGTIDLREIEANLTATIGDVVALIAECAHRRAAR